MVFRRVCWRDGRLMSPAARLRLCPRRASRAPGARILTRDAASSMASGSPSRRRQMAATSAALPGVTVKPGLTMSACCANSCAAAQAATSPAPAARGTSSGSTGCSCSPCRCSGRRDVASTTRPGAADSNAATTPAAPGSCSRLSRTSRAWRSCRCPVTISAAGRVPLTSRHSARVFHITSASRTAASGTKYTPCRKASASDEAAARASRVLPTPPVPVSVTRRTNGCRSLTLSRSTSPSLPISGVMGSGRLVRAPRLRNGGNRRCRRGATSW